MALNFPSTPTVGDLYPTPAQAGVPQYKWDGTVWVAQTIPDAPTYVKKVGDTMSGDLWISKASATLALQTPDQTTQPLLAFSHGALARWGLYVQGNAAAALALSRYDNAGSYVDSPLSIDRADGRVYITLNPTGPLGVATKQYVDAAASSFPAGTLMLFQQTAAPTGWTKQTTHNDKVLRVVSGAASWGGANAFSSVMAQTVVGSSTIAISQVGSHQHGNYLGLGHSADNYWATFNSGGSTNNVYYSFLSDAAGGGGNHNHTITMNIQYVDLIIASKN